MQERAFNALARAVIAANVTRDRCFAARAQFWIDHFGDRDISTISTGYKALPIAVAYDRDACDTVLDLNTGPA